MLQVVVEVGDTEGVELHTASKTKLPKRNRIKNIFSFGMILSDTEEHSYYFLKWCNATCAYLSIPQNLKRLETRGDLFSTNENESTETNGYEMK